ncbi:MAG TPA: redoxin domain-containing protein [Cyclobacteriaceae bacterium]|nr:redoxin domain-containing protein [Cyclobacteriaceae bacterium]
MKSVLLLVVLCCTLGLQAQTPVQNFSLTNASDGGQVSLDSYKHSAIVILFTSNACPYDTYYTERIRSLINTYLEKVPFILINSYQEPDESVEKMKLAIDKWNFHAPYLADKNQVVMEQLGAKKSPEAFLLSGSPGKYKIVFHGAIDDNAQSAEAVTTHYLKAAIDNVLAGRSETTTARVVGCTIRKK